MEHPALARGIEPDERALVQQTLRAAHRSTARLRAVLGALEHVTSALERIQTGGRTDALRNAAKELDWARGTSETAVRDAQELVDRMLDRLGAPPRLLLSSGEENARGGEP